MEKIVVTLLRSFPVNKRLRKKKTRIKIGKTREVGLKSEEDSVAIISKKRTQMRKAHNILINRFRAALLGKYKLEESKFDILIHDWKPGRFLLVEAKTASDGPGGRFQIRQAIGQLFDYRKNALRESIKKVDLAVLVPDRPLPDVVDLLKSLDIHTLWFKSDVLLGTTLL